MFIHRTLEAILAFVVVSKQGGGDRPVSRQRALDAINQSRPGAPDKTVAAAACRILVAFAFFCLHTAWAQLPYGVSVTPSAGSGVVGTPQNLTMTWASPSGQLPVSWGEFLIQDASVSTPTVTNACYMYVYTTGSVQPTYDDGTQQPVQDFVGTSYAPNVSNSRCQLNGPASSITATNSNLQAILNLQFSQLWTGKTLSIWLRAKNTSYQSGPWQQFGTFTVAGTGPSFTLSATASTATAGSTSTSTVTVTPANGFNSPVTLAASSWPTGITGTFATNPATASSQVTINVASTVAAGSYSLSVNGTSGALSAATTIALTVNAASGGGGTLPYGVSVTPSAGSGVVGTPQNLTMTWASPSGHLPVSWGEFLIQDASVSTPTVTNACYMYVYTTGSVQPTYDDGTQQPVQDFVGTSYAPNVSNSRCQLNGPASSITATNSNLQAILNLQFSQLWTGKTLSIWLRAKNTSYQSGPWQQFGTFTVAGTGPSFTLSATASTATAGSTSTSTVTVTPANGFNSPVTLAASSWPTGITGTFATNPATASSQVTINVASGVAAGSYSLSVNGTSGALSATTTIALTVNAASGGGGTLPYGVSVTPSAGSGVVGTPQSLTMTWASPSGQLPISWGEFLIQDASVTTPTISSACYMYVYASGAVQPTDDAGAPQSVLDFVGTSYAPNVYNLHCQLNGPPSSVTATNGNSNLQAVLNLQFSSLWTGKTLSVWLRARNTNYQPGNWQQLGTFTVAGTAPSFTLSSASATATAGSSTTSTVTVTSTNGFNSLVTLTATSWPTGITGTFGTNPATSSSLLTINVASTVAPGSYSLTVSGASGALSANTTIPLVVSGAVSFNLSTASTTIVAGSAGTSALSIVPGNGFNSPVTLAASNWPAGISGVFATNPTTSSSVATIQVGPNVGSGSYALTVIGTSGSQTSTATIPLTVNRSLSIGTPYLFTFTFAPPPSGSYVSTTVDFTGQLGLSAGGGACRVDYAYGSNQFIYYDDNGVTQPSGQTANSTCSIGSASLSHDGFGNIVETIAMTFKVANNSTELYTFGVYNSGLIGSSNNMTTPVDLGQYQVGVAGPPDFSVAPSPASVSVLQGSSAGLSLTVTSISSFSSQVTFTASSVANGPTCDTAQMTPTGPQTGVTITCHAAYSTVAGSYSTTLTATSGSLSQQIPLNVTVQALPAQPTFSGTLEQATCTAIQGWAWNSTQPNTPIAVQIYMDSNLVATVTAGDYRVDLVNAGKGNGYHGFTIPTPSNFFNGIAHQVYASVNGNNSVQLTNSPLPLTCAAGAPTYSGTVSGTCSAITGTVIDSMNPNQALTVGVYDGVSSPNPLMLILANAATPGPGGFSFGLPEALLDGVSHNAVVRVVAGTNSATGYEVGSPIPLTCPLGSAYQGAVDPVNPTQISGWVYDPNHPTANATVNLLVDGAVVKSFTANTYNQAAQGQGLCAYCGFSVPTPASVLDGDVHTIVVQSGAFSTTTQILQSSWNARLPVPRSITACAYSPATHTVFANLNGQNVLADKFPITKDDTFYFQVIANQPSVSSGGPYNSIQDEWELTLVVKSISPTEVIGPAVRDVPSYDNRFAFGQSADVSIPFDAGNQYVTPGTIYTLAGSIYAHFGCWVPALNNYAENVYASVGTAFHVVVEPEPAITSITPSPVDADTPTMFSVTGSGLGISGTVTFSPTGTTNVVASSDYTSQDGSHATLASSVSLPAGTYDVAPIVKNVSSDGGVTFGFQSVPQGQSKPGGKGSVTANGQVSLKVQYAPPRSQFTTISQGATVSITMDPAMPTITAQLVGPNNTPLAPQSMASYFVKIDWTQLKSPNCSINGATYGNFPLSNWESTGPVGPVQVSTAQPWNLSQAWANIGIRGGVAEIDWQYFATPTAAAVTGSFTFKIVGANPSESALRAQFASIGGPWFMERLAQEETQSRQFCVAPADGSPDRAPYCNWAPSPNLLPPVVQGMPIFGCPGGYGTFQLDPPDPNFLATTTLDRIWNWRANIQAGLDLVNAKDGGAFWQSQLSQLDTWNSARPNQTVSEPAPFSEGSYCTFYSSRNPITQPTGAVAVSPWYGDGVTLKRWNGTKMPANECVPVASGDCLTTPDFILLDNTSKDPNPPAPVWIITPQNQTSADIVRLYCDSIVP